MDGDGVYREVDAGLLLRPNYLPVDITYLELELFEKWSALDSCQGNHLRARHSALQYLGLFDDPDWNAEVLGSLCYRSLLYRTPGEFLGVGVVDRQLVIFCQDDDPEGEYYQAPALTDAELADWFEAMYAFAPECAPCVVDADCGDGVFCNGAEYCDQYGFCSPASAVVCDDGLVCTFDECSDDACAFSASVYGDADHDGDVDLFDIFCVLDGFAGKFETCSLKDVDIGDCEANGVVDLFDIFGVLDGFMDVDPCCAE